MKRKLIASALALSMVAGLAACNAADESAETTVAPAETAATEISEETTTTVAETTTEEIEETEETLPPEPVVREDRGQTADEDVPELEGYNLLWHDEFNGDTLDTDIWTREIRVAGWTNNELQAYVESEDNIFVTEGCLVLKATKEKQDNGKVNFYSGKVNSQNKTDFMYGRVEVCAKTPVGKGLWPAAWLMPTDQAYYGQWPQCGEIDIMEVLGHNTGTAYQTIHYGLPHASQQGTIVLGDNAFSDEFHVYALEWEPGEMRFYIDDELSFTCNDWFSAGGDGVEADYPAPFDQTFFVQLNLAVGGDWPGFPDKSTDFNKAEFYIDYVRVYQKPEYDTNVTKPVFEVREADSNGNFIVNSDFSDSEMDLKLNEDWNFLLFEEGAATATIHDNMIEIAPTNNGKQDYSVQLVHWDIPVVNGETYKVTFKAKADEDRTMKVAVTGPFADWARYYMDTKYELTSEWQDYEFEFTVNKRDDSRARLEFNMGKGDSTANIYITDVTFVKVS